MKRYARYALFLALLGLVCALLLGCGASVESETEVDIPQTESETEGAHVHATTQPPVKEMASTCCKEGYVQYRCDECLVRYVETLPLAKHEYKQQFDAALGYEVIKCNGCGDWRMELDGKQTVSLAAACSGTASVTFTAMGQPAELSFLVDGKEVKSEVYPAGDYTVVLAENLIAGGHTFDITLKNDGSGLDLHDLTVNGTLHRRDGLILEMTKTTAEHGNKYNDFFVYTKTSDPSGMYYIRYRFRHSYVTTPVMEKTDSTNNNNMFRIMAAELVKVESVNEASVKYSKICSLLTGGEIAVAIKEPETVDFIGGFHGEENIIDFWMYADDVEYTPGDEAKVVVCSYIEVYQLTDISRCNTPSEKIVEHEQTYYITAAGMQCERNVEWLVDDFEYSYAYIQMFTMLRKDGTKDICNTVETFDGNGESLGTKTVDFAIEKDTWVLGSKDNRSVKYTGSTGISAHVGFTILENSVAVDSVDVSLRRDAIGDNKWYAKFKSPNGSKFSIKGQVWKLDTFYRIDYVDPEAR